MNIVWFYDYKKKAFLKCNEEEIKSVVMPEDYKIIGLIACHKENLEGLESELVAIGLLNSQEKKIEVLNTSKMLDVLEDEDGTKYITKIVPYEETQEYLHEQAKNKLSISEEQKLQDVLVDESTK